MKKIYLIFLLLLGVTFVFSQDEAADEGLIYDNQVYVDYIKTVQLHVPGVITSLPMINLGGGRLTLAFDDMEGEHEYVYSVVHCNADWTPSELTEMEYLDGFNEERIYNEEFSFNTLTNYTHYEQVFPNEDMTFLVSGNYLLKVYNNDDEKYLVLTRRFMVVDQRFAISPEIKPTSMVKKARTHQEVDFIVTHKGIKIANPRQELNVMVLQNGRWDTAIKNIQPQFIKNEKLVYDLLDKIVFPAGKEFRYFDIRSLRYRTNHVRGIEEYKDGYDVTLYMDKMRGFSAYYNIKDINGGFVIGNVDRNNAMSISFSDSDTEKSRAAKMDILRRQIIENRASNNVESDYANVLFSLEMNEPLYDKEVYVFGGLTDWKIKDEFKMTYQDVVNAYVADIFLKQGYYNYMYVTVPKKGAKIPDIEELEGNWYETENEYTILVYYRPFGERYDHLVAGRTFKSYR
ncbi:MAG TPA: DUF5103 domain-containing protein [Phaeodactylibacter sp.]|nr:DUF5103 domain-containing protein [Phaeodactylibacter sp.]